jgi:hypothetical protein
MRRGFVAVLFFAALGFSAQAKSRSEKKLNWERQL